MSLSIRNQIAGTVISVTPGQVRHLGPPLGQDNDAVYGDVLGLDADARRELHEQGVI